ncbi:MAG: apolipoprotein N-acyltransferase [Hyphomonadaceae bacterium]|nr:apolipoprotein N-acyltransferase [Hyphomonadaceae bacterium]OUX94395.1 MAG: apolipoprotein N-acyltransferase [Hyphomonas sp. TMED17]
MSMSGSAHGVEFLQPIYRVVTGCGPIRAMLLAVMLGVAAAFAFAPIHATPLLAVAFIGLVWLIDTARHYERWGRHVFAVSWAFGFGFFFVSMYWTALPFLVDPERHAKYLWMPLFLLPAGMAVIWGTACSVAAAFWSSSPSRVFVFALFMGLAEYLRGVLFGGFPWNLPATSWIPGGAFSQLASLGGVYWLNLVTLFIMVAPASLLDTRDAPGALFRAVPTMLAGFILIVGWIWGYQRLSNETLYDEQHVMLVDAGVPQADKFDGGGRPLLQRYVALLEQESGAAGDVVILPEGAFPFQFLESNIAQAAMFEALGPRSLIIGTTRRRVRGDYYNYHNSLSVFAPTDAAADMIALYDKHRLVPFGELAAAHIIPFGELISDYLPDALQRVALSGFVPGAGPAVLFPADIIPPFVPLICYEGLFPELLRNAEPQRTEAKWIVVISNDAWFGAGFGPAQHYAQNQYRAIESGLPMARVASRGVTAMIDGFGREVARGSSRDGDPAGWRSSVVRSKLPLAVDNTVYQSTGQRMYWITLFVLSILSFIFWRRWT